MNPQIPPMTQAGIRLQNRWYEESKAVGSQDQKQEITEHGMVYFKQGGEIRVKEEPVDFPKRIYAQSNIIFNPGQHPELLLDL